VNINPNFHENSCLFGGGCDIIVQEVVGNNFMDIKIETVSEEGTDLLAPSCDFVFRNIFGTNGHKAELISLLNAILNGNPHIKELTIENGDIPKDIENGKSIRLDINATADDCTKLVIEIQCYDGGRVINRSAFGQSKQMPEELKEGESYDKIPNLISIWFTTYKETKRRYHTSEAVYMFKESPLDPVEVATEKFRTIIVELKKIDLSKAKADNMFYVWSYFLIAPKEIPEEFLKIKEVNDAMNTLSHVSQDPNKRRVYNSIVRIRNDKINDMTHARDQGIAIGEKRGEKRGIAIGEERGIAIGREEGELRKAREMARIMLAEGLDATLINKCTELSLQEIESLKK
jgi:predicted transposase/invertase (TIGR01784 family)